MIRFIKGELVEVGHERAIVAAGGLGYEVIVSELTAERLAARGPGAEVELHTFHYYALDPSRATPVLLGFDSPLQLAFFERLLEVPRVGPRLACRMLAAPVANIARAIELGDVKFLASLPGIGASKARDLSNALKGKVADFATADDALAPGGGPEPTMEADAIEVLTQLGYPIVEARQRVLEAQARRSDIGTLEHLVAEALADRG
jgi:Holliday junction DNA helicase RuvA